MPADGDLTEHALNSSHDFYELLGVTAVSSESEIRRAWRKTALFYHPDKVGADPEKLEKFHLLQIALDVLCDSTARQVYDNARRAREEKKERESAYEDRRRHLKEELERRESEGVAGLKRKRQEDKEEEAFQSELKRLAADGARRRKEREEQLRREAEELGKASSIDQEAVSAKDTSNGDSDDLDRMVKLRFATDAPEARALDRESITARFSRFGKIEHVSLKPKKVKVEGQKHRREYTIVFILFQSIVGAHAAVTDFPTVAANGEDIIWKVFQDLNWAGGKEPDCIPKPRSRPDSSHRGGNVDGRIDDVSMSLPSTPKAQRTGDGLRKVPSFASFKATPKGSPSVEELQFIRLKNVERERLAKKLREEEEAEDHKEET